MEPADEKELLLRSQNGDPAYLGLIYDRYNQGLYRYALRLLGDESLAEECVADTFSKFLKSLQQKKGPKDFLQAYLYRIAHNWITDWYRQKHTQFDQLEETIPASEQFHPETMTIAQIEQEKLRKALNLLSADQRLVVILRFIENWDNEQVSKALQRPIGAVKALQHRALTNLRKILS